MSDKEFVTVDPVTIIIKECINLSTAMRKYSKFTSQSGVAALLGEEVKYLAIKMTTWLTHSTI